MMKLGFGEMEGRVKLPLIFEIWGSSLGFTTLASPIILSSFNIVLLLRIGRAKEKGE